MPEPVTLHPALWWICPDCGRQAAIHRDTPPPEVACPYCGAVAEVGGVGDVDDDQA